jgi:glucokinase
MCAFSGEDYPEAAVAAVDLGGTWMRAALVSAGGAVGPIVRRPTEAARPQSQIIDDLLRLLAEVREARAGEAPIAGAAIGIATVLDREGRILPCPNLPTLGGLELGRHVQSRLGLPVTVSNDASCFTVGEWWMGAARGAWNLCGVTLGTGIGLGLVINGQVYRGSHGFAGEIWNTPMEGSFLEAQVCAGAIERSYQSVSGTALSGDEIAALADLGDAQARETFADFGRTLGAVISFLVNTLDPEVVVFGGSISRSFDHFRQPLAEVVAASTTQGGRTRLERSALGDSASLLGAAKLFWDSRR